MVLPDIPTKENSTNLEHEYEGQEQEHVDDPEYSHPLARDADDEEHDDDHVDPIEGASGPQPFAERFQETRFCLVFALSFYCC